MGKLPKIKVYGYAVEKIYVDKMIEALDKASELTKHECGSPDDMDGHAITYKYMNQDVFKAMIHSNRRYYLVSMLPGLLERTFEIET